MYGTESCQHQHWGSKGRQGSTSGSRIRDCRLGGKRLIIPLKPDTTSISDMVMSEMHVGARASGKSELKQRGDRVGIGGLLYFLKRHPMKDGGPMVWQMMDLKIRTYTERYRRQGGREESQAVDGYNEKSPRNL